MGGSVKSKRYASYTKRFYLLERFITGEGGFNHILQGMHFQEGLIQNIFLIYLHFIGELLKASIFVT
jgi:hypothetical protein